LRAAGEMNFAATMWMEAFEGSGVGADEIKHPRRAMAGLGCGYFGV
jgi:hypothetical protein